MKNHEHKCQTCGGWLNELRECENCLAKTTTRKITLEDVVEAAHSAGVKVSVKLEPKQTPMKKLIFEMIDGDASVSIGVPSNRGNQSNLIIKSNGDDVMMCLSEIKILRNRLTDHIESSNTTPFWFVMNGWKHYCEGPTIYGADVRVKLPPECRDYMIGIVNGQKVEYINDTTAIPNGVEMCFVPHAHV